jgi:hypothetical protein
MYVEVPVPTGQNGRAFFPSQYLNFCCSLHVKGYLSLRLTSETMTL